MTIAWHELAAATGGTWTTQPPLYPVGVERVVDDSRRIQPGDLYIAIRGEIADGHDFIDAAAAAGAAAICIEATRPAGRRPAPKGLPVIVVGDGLLAFHRLARTHRDQFPDLTVAAITGSSGKTSARAMLAAVCNQAWPGQTLTTQGNTNNHFGVPRNVLRLTDQHRVAVLELGTNHPGEIRTLARIVGASIGIITSIGRAHLEFLGSLEGVATEKGTLLESLPDDGIAILPADSPQLPLLRKAAGNRRCLTFGTGHDADLRVCYEGRVGDGYAATLSWTATAEVRQLHWAVGGAHQALNAAAAAATALALGIDPDTVIEGLRGVELPGMRMQVQEVDGVNWVNDAYNANPESVRASIDWFAELTGPDRTVPCFAILGDMLELGATAEAEHHDVLRQARERLPGVRLIAVGHMMTRAAAEETDILTFTTAETAAAWLRGRPVAGSWVLLKGSRGIHLERVLPAHPG